MTVSELVSSLLTSKSKNSSRPLQAKKSFKVLLKSRIVNAEKGKLSQLTEFDLEEISSLLNEIHSLGDILIVEPSITNVRFYKEKIGEFLEYVVNFGIGLKNERGQLRENFKRSSYTLISVIDSKLDKLANSVLQNQSTQLKLLESIGEIQGLLIDLVR